MKNLSIIVIAVVVLAIAGVAHATSDNSRYAGVDASADERGNVTIPPLPNGTLVDIELYNDCEGTDIDRIGPQSNFKFPDKCSSMNFLWKAADTGRTYFQRITPATKPGGALKAIYHPKGYKYGLSTADVNAR